MKFGKNDGAKQADIDMIQTTQPTRAKCGNVRSVHIQHVPKSARKVLPFMKKWDIHNNVQNIKNKEQNGIKQRFKRKLLENGEDERRRDWPIPAENFPSFL